MRVPRWDAALMDWAASAIGRPFAWGQTDCALICCEAFDALTGGGLAEQHRGRWHDLDSAVAFQAEHDTDLERTLRGAGCVEVRPGFQQRGDLILHRADRFVVGAVCLGRDSIGSPLDDPVRTVKTAAVLRLPGTMILRAA